MKQTENLQLPILQNGDKYTKETQNEAFKKIDLHLGGLAKRVNDIILSDGNSNIEIVDARRDNITGVVYDTIGERINAISSNIDNNSNDINELSNRINSISVNVETIGVKQGQTVDVSKKNTAIIQHILDNNDDVVLLFPSGVYRLNKLNFGENKNVTFIGKSSSFATSVNKSVSTPKILDTYTRIVVDLDENDNFIEHTNCTIILDKVSFINGNINSSNTPDLLNKNLFVKTGQNSTKGKVFCTDCSFIGWKQVGGDLDVFSKDSDLLHCCFMANRCRFTENTIALAQILDSRIIDCTFNKNNYAIVNKTNSGISTIMGCRFEWNRENAIYLNNSKEMTIVDNEFDRQGKSAIYVENTKTSNISNNVFRRNGANTDIVTSTDSVNNNHICIINSSEIICIGNTTVKKSVLDIGGGAERPTFATYICNNSYVNVVNNNFRGCTKSNKTEGNVIADNTDSTISNNLY